MARKSFKPTNEQPLEESEATYAEPAEPESEEIEPASRSGKSVSKSEAARAAIARGIKSPGEAVAFIKKTYGIDMGPQHFSSVKSQMKRSQQNYRATGRSSLADSIAGGGDSELLDALEGIKELVDQYGADRVKRMVDLLGSTR